jgi:hypothetical protein
MSEIRKVKIEEDGNLVITCGKWRGHFVMCCHMDCLCSALCAAFDSRSKSAYAPSQVFCGIMDDFGPIGQLEDDDIGTDKVPR